MRILITAAEEEEIITAKQAFNSLGREEQAKLEVVYLLTGIGTTSVSYRLTKMLAFPDKKFDLVVNIGIAGSFSEHFPIGSVAVIEKEYFGDLGFETAYGFRTLFDYDILDADTYPFRGGALYAPEPVGGIKSALNEYGKATAVTVQTVSGFPEKRSRLERDFKPHIESMEGAAVFYICLLEGIPFIEIRSVSNEVGEKEKSKWNIPLALEALKNACGKLLRGTVS